jgi:hypothetical protein
VQLSRGNSLIAPMLMALVSAIGLAWALWTSRQIAAETPAPAVQQSDGSMILERTAPQPKAKPKQTIPKGLKVERIEQVTVQPTARAEAGKPCPPVTVDMTLLREPDGGRRVVASSPDGQVVAGLDIPAGTILVASPKWSAGITMNPTRQTYGVWMDRNVSRLRVGAALLQRDDRRGADPWIRVGWSFD